MENKTAENRIRELIGKLNEASRAYYARDTEIMDNFTYDRLYDELTALEAETGIQFADSPTANVGYEAVEELPKVLHESPMLSLDKTKDLEVLRQFIGENPTLLSWKMDGLTVVLTYEEGKLSRAVTRGNGYEGEVVTANAKTMKGLPLQIPFTGRLILRGEAYIRYSDFEKINETIEDVDARYKNPRNLCSGSLRQLDSSVTAKRSVRCMAFSLVYAENAQLQNSHQKEMEFLSALGFETVPFETVTAATLDAAMEKFMTQIAHNDFPSDGLVAIYDDIEYGKSLGTTAKFPKNALAFKWADELKNTHLLEVEWSPSRTGLINPVAIFEPVELEGTTVSRASIHNISILRELKLGLGDEITVYKANMIIPQIAENLTKSDTLQIPDTCPACGSRTQIRSENDTKTLFCPNPECPAKKIKSYTLLVSRDALNIEGLSEETLRKFIAAGLIHERADIFNLSLHEEEITQMEGFGEKSFRKLTESIEKAKNTTPVRLLYGMGIPNIGLSGAKLIVEYFGGDMTKIMDASEEELCRIEKIAGVIAGEYVRWWQSEENRLSFLHVLSHLQLKQEEKGAAIEGIAGKTFVITGSVRYYENRAALKKEIESAGGKVTGSVTGKTDYLINNDTTSSSTKNKTAMKLGVKIISEEDYIKMKGE